MAYRPRLTKRRQRALQHVVHIEADDLALRRWLENEVCERILYEPRGGAISARLRAAVQEDDWQIEQRIADLPSGISPVNVLRRS